MIVIEPPSSGFDQQAIDSISRSSLARFLKRARAAVGLAGEVTLLLADDDRVRSLNRQFRGKNKTTDVLSFPAAENGEGVAGDVAVSLPVALAQAANHGHSLAQELRILTLHGLLHLAGHNHETDKGEMRQLETALRKRFRLPVSLIERTMGAPQPKSRRTIAKARP